jgi:hypothetical protein
MWPAFIATTLVDGWLLHHWPPVRFGFSETGIDIGAAIIIAAFGNLFLIAAVTPFLAKRLAVRQAAEQPGQVSDRALLEVYKDRTGTGLMAVGVVGVLAAGLASIPLLNGETDSRNRANRALVSFVEGHAPAQIKRNNDQGVAQTVRLADGLFRTCIPFDDRHRYYCVFIDTNRRPTSIRLDHSQEPNKPLSAGPGG